MGGRGKGEGAGRRGSPIGTSETELPLLYSRVRCYTVARVSLLCMSLLSLILSRIFSLILSLLSLILSLILSLPLPSAPFLRSSSFLCALHLSVLSALSLDSRLRRPTPSCFLSVPRSFPRKVHAFSMLGARPVFVDPGPLTSAPLQVFPRVTFQLNTCSKRCKITISIRSIK